MRFPEQQDLTTGMGIALTVSMVSTFVLMPVPFVAMPDAVVAAALASWIVGLVTLGVLTHRQARRNDVGFWRSLGRGLRRFFGSALELMP